MQSIGIGDYLLSTLETFQDNFVKALSLIYDKYTVDEWMEQHIEPLMKMLTSLMQRAQTLTNSDIWPRRPLNFNKLSTSSKSGSADHSKGKKQAQYQDEISEDHGEDGLLTKDGAWRRNSPPKEIGSNTNQRQDESLDRRNEERKILEQNLLPPGDSLQENENKKLLSVRRHQ
jgi:organic radical activating enzyme